MARLKSRSRSGLTRELASRGARPLHVERLEDRRLLAGRAADAINAFAFDVYDQMQRESGNLFYSPTSLATALAMTYAGARGNTATQLENVLHLGSAPGIHQSFQTLLASLESHSAPNGPAIEVANAIWPGTGTALNPSYVDVISNNYDGYIQTVNYGNPSLAIDTINNWVADNTHQKIKNLIDELSPDTTLVLTNAMYFQASWANQFRPESTSSGSFLRSDGTTVAVPMMATQMNSKTGLFRVGGFTVAELPLAPGANNANLSMIVAMPTSPTGDSRFTHTEFAQIESALAAPYPDFFDVGLPKFSIATSTEFTKLIPGLGAIDAFGPGADFSGIAPNFGWIDRVLHKATLDVNEQGVTAAAATAVSGILCFAKGTPVLTPDGPRPIENLKVGDLVLSRDENNLEGPVHPRPVEQVYRGEAEIVELVIGGRLVRTTDPHPFFVRGRGWTAAADLVPGDLLFTDVGEWVALTSRRATGEVEPVYNFHVAVDQTYFVGDDDWGFGVWVHNSYGSSITFNRTFHVFIRDNLTSTILFMGRINDPTQAQNSIIPTVVPEPSTAVLCAVGVIVAGAHDWRRRKKRLEANAIAGGQLSARCVDWALADD